jgi:hypothetical protein
LRSDPPGRKEIVVNVGETCNRIVVFAHPEEGVREAEVRR